MPFTCLREILVILPFSEFLNTKDPVISAFASSLLGLNITRKLGLFEMFKVEKKTQKITESRDQRHRRHEGLWICNNSTISVFYATLASEQDLTARGSYFVF